MKVADLFIALGFQVDEEKIKKVDTSLKQMRVVDNTHNILYQ